MTLIFTEIPFTVYIIHTFTGTIIVALQDTQAISHPTIGHSECSLIVSGEGVDRCYKCTKYRSTLHALASRE